MKIKLYIILTCIILFGSCSSNLPKNSILVKQVESEYPIKIWTSKNRDRITSISIPLAFKYTNNAKKGKHYEIVYKYNNKDGGYWTSIKVYTQKIDTRVYLVPTYKDEINDGNTHKLIAYTSHSIDSNFNTQELLDSYLEEIKNKEELELKDGLEIESFNKFKEKYPNLIKTLLSGDSISFAVIDSNKRNIEEQKIYVDLPIKY